MEQLKQMKSMLTACVQSEITNLKDSDYQELGAAVDMIKDLSEAIYYCSIVEAMEKKEKEEKEKSEERYYPMYMPMNYNRDYDRGMGRMYYDGERYYNGGGSGGSGGSGSSGGNSGGSGGGGSRGYSESSNRDRQDSRGRDERGYSESEYPKINFAMRDSREGRSPASRRSYMEAKEMHHDKATKIKELEAYIQELGKDLTEMISDASPEEKQLLQKKLAALATKVDA